MVKFDRRPDPELVADVLDEALERPPAERPTWLAARCDGDEALEREVLELLRYLPDPERPGDDREASELRAGDVVAGCRIEREIGRGGMGVIYSAEQIEPRRPVAVKVLRSAFLGPDALVDLAVDGLVAPVRARVYSLGLP